MILETAQMLCTSHSETSSPFIARVPYRSTHKNHPCNIWIRESLSNYDWLVQLGLELCSEYTKRYKKIHKTQQYIEWLAEHKPILDASKGITTRPQCMPDKYMGDDVVNAYRRYYIGEKSGIAKWNTGIIPTWFHYDTANKFV